MISKSPTSTSNYVAARLSSRESTAMGVEFLFAEEHKNLSCYLFTGEPSQQIHNIASDNISGSNDLLWADLRTSKRSGRYRFVKAIPT